MSLYMDMANELVVCLNYHPDDARKIAKKYSRRKNAIQDFEREILPKWYVDTPIKSKAD